MQPVGSDGQHGKILPACCMERGKTGAQVPVAFVNAFTTSAGQAARADRCFALTGVRVEWHHWLTDTNLGLAARRHQVE